jgi:uncharacterized membrane protein HdeD (DUF308 family)
MGILIGILVFAYPLSPFVILTFLIILLGVWSVIYGALRLACAFKGVGIGMAVLGLLTIVLGILSLLNSLAGAVILPRVYVFSLVVGGIAALIGGL